MKNIVKIIKIYKAVVKALKLREIDKNSCTTKFNDNLKKSFKKKYYSIVSGGTMCLHPIDTLYNCKLKHIILLAIINSLTAANAILYDGCKIFFVRYK